MNFVAFFWGRRAFVAPLPPPQPPPPPPPPPPLPPLLQTQANIAVGRNH